MSIASLLLATLAFALLASASQPLMRRWSLPSGKSAKRRRCFAAAFLLAASFPPAIAAQGWIFGPIAWSGAIMLGAGVVFVAIHARKAS